MRSRCGGHASRWPQRLAVLVALLIALQGAASLADTKEEEAQAQIAELKSQIALIQAGMAEKNSKRDALQSQLRATEIEIGQLDRSLDTVKQAIAAELPRLSALDEERQALLAQVDQQQQALRDELKNLWALQQGGGIRILFGDQSPERLARNLAYYKKLLDARQNQIATFSALLEKVAANTAAIRVSQQRLAQQRAQLEQQRAQTDALQNERRETLSAIQRSLSNDKQKKVKLEADAEELAQLLEQLRQTLAELDTPSSYRPFSEVKGALRLPVEGRPSNRYGGQRNAANMRWRGWLIPAREGSNVKAIHHGRVVYADWLRGQGLLLILDHGEGYLSLYGHNRSLQRDVGDWVRPGDIIATVGASGGADNPGVYFEIRENGQPINPDSWIRR